MTAATKRCPRCGEDKELSAFAPNRGKALGRDSHCNRCKLSARRARLADPERARCGVIGCGCPAAYAGLCQTHYMRKVRGQADADTPAAIGAYDRFDLLVAAFDRWLEAETDLEFNDAAESIKTAARRFTYWDNDMRKGNAGARKNGSKRAAA